MADKELIKKAREFKAAQKRQRIAELLTPHINDLYDLLKADVSLRIIEKTINDQIGVSVSHTSIGYFLKLNFPDDYNRYVRARRNGNGVVGRPRKTERETPKTSSPGKKGISEKSNEDVPLVAKEFEDSKQNLSEKDQSVGVENQKPPLSIESASSSNSLGVGAGGNVEGERPKTPARNRKGVNLESVAAQYINSNPD